MFLVAQLRHLALGEPRAPICAPTCLESYGAAVVRCGSDHASKKCLFLEHLYVPSEEFGQGKSDERSAECTRRETKDDAILVLPWFLSVGAVLCTSDEGRM